MPFDHFSRPASSRLRSIPFNCESRPRAAAKRLVGPRGTDVKVLHERQRDRDLAEAQERPAAVAVMRQVAPSIWARARAAKEEPRAPKSTARLNERL